MSDFPKRTVEQIMACLPLLARIDELVKNRYELRETIESITAQRDEARRLVIEADWCRDATAKYADLWTARGWPVPAPQTTTLTCPYCDYSEVVHGKPSPSDHAPCGFCNAEHYGD